MGKCIHGIEETYCGLCQDRDSDPAKSRSARSGQTVQRRKSSGQITQAERFAAQLRFMRDLNGPKLKLFLEMRELGLNAAEMLAFYLGLGFPQSHNLQDVGIEFGCSAAHAGVMVSAVIHFLDMSEPAAKPGQQVPVTETGREQAVTIGRRLEKLRQARRAQDRRRRKL
ncbi:hypothetical protein KKC88_03370 [Patescibacteria group bacterium]|nr:hypothetical protein [Patescibacteria group bacterium]MBU1673832.1 hypothetical protein [Patescibacteria group bacterium]MBU1963611.1 hypothetical protein [Patescibacteria group bacterium]